MHMIRTIGSWATVFVLVTLAGALKAAEPIPFGTVTSGNKDIVAAWLSDPVARYPHGVLGDSLEASTLRVRLLDGTELAAALSVRVFEDNTPRLADIDGDGRDEVWTVISDFIGGARLVAYGVVAGELVQRFSTAPIGLGFRWLNPLAVADFDGDGQKEVAYIQTPHIGGILTIVRPVGSELQVVAVRSGYSTHAMGSEFLDLGVAVDLDGDGAAELLLPDQKRRRLSIVQLRDGKLHVRWTSGTLARIDAGLRAVAGANGWQATYRSAGGHTVQTPLPGL
jgi:hypothetical protein